MKKKLPLAFSFIIAYSLTINAQKTISLEDIWLKGTFQPQLIYGLNSMKDGLHYTSLKQQDKESFIIKFDYRTGKAMDTVLRSSQLRGENGKPITIESYRFSSDESNIIVSSDVEPIYRHSSKESNYIWNTKTKKASPLSTNGKQMHATFSPDGSKIAFVRDNNIFIKDIAGNAETQVTKDGELNKIINGTADWVYEEEFAFDQAFFWSPDGSKIAYYRFDEAHVKEFMMPLYGPLYPREYRFKYPKAGEANAYVTLHVYNLSNGITKSVDVGSEKDQYIPRVKWTKDAETLSFIRMNRLQNKLELLLANVQTGASRTILTEESQTYVDVTDHLVFLDDKKTFLFSSEKDGFHHLYHYDISGKLLNQITKGNWDVTDFKGIDEKNKLLYFLSAEVDPADRDLYVIKLDGSGKKKLSGGKGTNSAQFSEGFKYYINTYSDANTPFYVSLHSTDGKQIRALEENMELKDKLKNYPWCKKEFFSFKTSEGIALNAWMIKPPNFDAAKKYPVFMTIYGGPGSNTVKNTWDVSNIMWHQLLAQKGYIVVSVDNRGTGSRGAAFKKCTYMQMGKLETIDMIETAKHLGSLAYVDKTRIGIQGWSYGGYMSSLCITKGADYFKAAIAIAPVTNWRFYDSIYTERFMRSPQENPQGYDDNSPINHVENIKGKYLLVHGTADDNVHFQNTVEMIDALIKANKYIDTFFYPNRNHGIYGENTRLHIYTLMTDFLLKNL